MEAVIRPAVEADIPTLALLIEEIERYYGATEIQALDERRDQIALALFGVPPLASVLIAEDRSGELLGLAAYSFLWPAAGSTHSLFLKELFVRESGRRQGVASQLMQALREITAGRPGCSRIEWMADRDNPAAREFYRALGVPEADNKIVYRIAK